ncbi:MAG: adenosylcobalamin-dependent ribonucleoside-diphosphate reductase [Methanobacteriota archaeon]|nr:MAG: adenosylcobalamin-dependent ribonucleoside-diphosphate reductase [Euryarchaeota archaeon]
MGFNSTDSVPFQKASIDIWQQKYQLIDKDGNQIDKDIEDTYSRVASALAKVEEPRKRGVWKKKFLWAMRHGAIPAGRIISNAGAEEYKPETSTINCTVSSTIEDSMHGILMAVHDAGLTLKAGCGIGYEFSTLRPNGAYVSGAGASTSGPLSFMDIFDKMCFTISSAGGRRGAQMATFDVSHPDIIEFIRAKREDGRLRQFNMSCLITKDFMNAVKNNKEWELVFPASKHDLDDFENGKAEIVWRRMPHLVNNPHYKVNEKGEIACKVYKKVPARRLWDVIMSSTYDYAEPGFLLIDEANRQNNNWFCEDIRASNPCGEQLLPPNGACLLGSVNLTKFVHNPFTDNATFDWETFNKVVKIFTRMLDNVVEINGLPLEEQRREIEHKRRHGMGFLGLGSTLAMLGIRYGSKESVEFTEKVALEMALTGYWTGIELAKEKGCAPVFNEEIEVTTHNLDKFIDHGIDAKVGQKFKAVDLWLRSHYMQRLIHAMGDKAEEFVSEIRKHGCRFTHHTSIAPTGTISLSLGNNASNGIEPSFAHHYKRNVIRAGRKTKEQIDVYSFELLAYRHFVNPDAMPDDLPSYCVTSDNIHPKEHVDIQAAAQKWVDSSISKTINVPTDFPYEEFKDIYLYAYEKGLKGCTTFRFNPEAFQGVLVKEEDLENTTYRFKMDDGTVIEAKGNEEIEYDGEIMTAANLFDALKEGYFGKL